MRLGVQRGAPAEAARRSRPSSPWPIEEVVPGRWLENRGGRCYVSVARRAVSERHGRAPLEGALAETGATLAALAQNPDLAALDLRTAVFVDTETTGLAGGTGTYAFLIGIGRFEGDSYRIDQVFMADPSQEAAQLEHAAELVQGASGIVTFNGRTFDLPLLATRYRLHRRRSPFDDLPHLDLLPVARRLFRRRLPSCALASLEAHVLGVRRQADVPGCLVPTRYFDFQRDGDARPLAGVFGHNVTDIVSMVSLTAHLGRAYRAPDDTLQDAEDWLSLARLYAACGRWLEAAVACERASATARNRALAEEALEAAGQAARRAGDWSRAAAAWQRWIELGPRRLTPFEELAKYYEHRAPARDPAQALALIEAARERLLRGEFRASPRPAAALRQLEHRRRRLLGKLAARASVRPTSAGSSAAPEAG